ncbi:hypothetical protein F0L68_03385 [Solihabitans fulvus]|uniref:Alpha/beta hydrolase family protein n=1 Tax=Solihabitans fulvus TaxID=1892852 RepID=A0A5B2XTB8_9PSEU|nr:alpha/beta hydrolase [Solihabitans fulvus]KAA2266170.1 hypothetical protein F0L68_03385 [Solihabitans fulvus]
MSSLPYVIVLHGFTGSGPEHWQSWAAGELARAGGAVEYPQFTDPDRPDRATWLAELTEHLAAAPTEVERVVLAHSLGAHLWLHHAAGEFDPALRVDRVLLVAPPGPTWEDPDVVGWQPLPLDPTGLRRAAGSTRLVTGDDDPYCAVAEATAMAEALFIDHDVVPGGAHLNIVAGYGPWPALLDWVRHGRTPLTGR